MTTHQALILARLQDADGEYVPVPELLAVNGRADSFANRQVLRTHIYRLRRQISLWGKIESQRGSYSQGYRLIALLDDHLREAACFRSKETANG